LRTELFGPIVPIPCSPLRFWWVFCHLTRVFPVSPPLLPEGQGSLYLFELRARASSLFYVRFLAMLRKPPGPSASDSSLYHFVVRTLSLRDPAYPPRAPAIDQISSRFFPARSFRYLSLGTVPSCWLFDVFILLRFLLAACC